MEEYSYNKALTDVIDLLEKKKLSDEAAAQTGASLLLGLIIDSLVKEVRELEIK